MIVEKGGPQKRDMTALPVYSTCQPCPGWTPPSFAESNLLWSHLCCHILLCCNLTIWHGTSSQGHSKSGIQLAKHLRRNNYQNKMWKINWVSWFRIQLSPMSILFHTYKKEINSNLSFLGCSAILRRNKILFLSAPDNSCIGFQCFLGALGTGKLKKVLCFSSSESFSPVMSGSVSSGTMECSPSPNTQILQPRSSKADGLSSS